MVVDDHSLVRAGVKALLEREPDLHVVSEAADGRDALARIDATAVDLVVMDVSMPYLDGIDATARLRELHPDLRVLMLSMHATPSCAGRALEAGAIGYCAKEAGEDDLLVGIQSALRGESHLSPVLSRGTESTAAMPKYPARLTGRQRQILELIALGNTSKQIARTLVISVKTVESHRSALMRILSIHELAGLVRYAIRIGLVDAYEDRRSTLSGQVPQAAA